MPRGDRTGPAGMGPMTGRRAGYCAGYSAPGFANPVPGYGMGWGCGYGGGGHGWRHWYRATGLPGWARAGYVPAWGPPPAPYAPAMTREQEIETLKGQAQYFQDALGDISKRIAELEKET